jgi:hypothetical protein
LVIFTVFIKFQILERDEDVPFGSTQKILLIFAPLDFQMRKKGFPF